MRSVVMQCFRDHYLSRGYFEVKQGSHRLEKYLNIQDCLEKSLKIKFALKSTGKNTQKHLKVPEFYHLQEDSTLSLETKSV